MKQWKVLFLCTLFVALSTLLYTCVPNAQAHLDLDSSGYDRIACHAAQTGVLKDPTYHDIPVQTLGYPFFLSGIYALVGHSYKAVVIAQVTLSVLIGLMIYGCAAVLVSHTLGLLALGLWAVHPGFLIFSQFILTEILLTTLLTTALCLGCLYYVSKRESYLLASFLIAGVSLLVKPIMLWYVPCLALILWWLLADSAMGKIKLLSKSLLLFGIPLFGYCFYNYTLYQSFTFGPLAQENLYYYYLPRIIQKDTGKTLDEAKHEVKSLCTNFDRVDPQRWSKPRALLVTYITHQPILACWVWLENVCKTLFGLYATQLKILLQPEIKGSELSFFSGEGSVLQRANAYLARGTRGSWVRYCIWFEVISSLTKIVLIFLALLFLVWQKHYSVVVLVTSFIGYCAFITGHDGCGRYRMPFEPLLILLSAYAILYLYTWFKSFKGISYEITKRNARIHSNL